ncbi:ferritin-like domain-containing protein [Roseomonas sp. 18066]|uniref:ferritin-like domain-containing protein n=1 Tax=Roseomonas sp. 18066 TaxID=2681412 RepID=UPI001359CDEF|nr:ferritin-like domain-containing protein [Roseomonas sp. 18066]
MAIMVGTEAGLPCLVESLLLLEQDAIAAYDQGMARLDNPVARAAVASFRTDHDRHLAALTLLADRLPRQPLPEGSATMPLTARQASLSALAGDGAILTAMRGKEDDTAIAYERAAQHPAATPEAQAVFRRAQADALRHRDWMAYPG